jgi:hypothetical protein
MGKAFGRIASFVIVAGSWLLFGVRAVLSLIGYATLPEDAAVAGHRYRHVLLSLLSIPWPYLFGFALIATILLMILSWPGLSFPLSSDTYSTLRVDAAGLIERLRRQQRTVGTPLYEPDTQLPHDVRAFYFDLQDHGIKVPVEPLGAKSAEGYAARCGLHAFYLESLKPFLKRKRVGAAKRSAQELLPHLHGEFARLEEEK